jgi:hypothetical protein
VDNKLDTLRIRKAKERRGYTVSLNGIDVSKHINQIEMRLTAGEPPFVALILTRTHVDLPEELQARVVVVDGNKKEGESNVETVSE